MSEQLTLPAETRERAGKGASRALRREGRVPAVVYGEKKEPLSVHVEEKLLTKMMSTGHFMNSVVMVDVGGKPNRTLAQGRAVPPGHQPADPRRFPAHRRAQPGARQRPVRFNDEEESPGLKRGGVLNVVRHDLELVCDAAKIPDEITISLDGLDIGDSLHISASRRCRKARSRRSTTATSPSRRSSLRRR